MAERPLLLFPQPEVASRSKQKSFGGKVNTPSHQRQIDRLTPVFSQLQSAFIEIQSTAAGADPEQVLVIEIIGDIKDFANAVKRIEGFEWMGEWEEDEIPPDADFFVEENPEKQLSGRLYLVMANQRALENMLSLWRRYQADPSVKFNSGLNKFKEVFKTLKSIRRWGVQDRLIETGVLDEWRELLQQSYGQVRFEVELWFRDVHEKRQISQTNVARLITDLGGQILGQCVLPEITYHALLAELPANAIQNIVDNPNTELVKSDSVMFFRPSGQVSAGDQPTEGNIEQLSAQVGKLPSGNPVIAILDGMPLPNHQLLSDRIILDDPDGWNSDYPVSERTHGTMMASLVIHGDLNASSRVPLRTPLYMRPIMRPNPPWVRQRREVIPEDVLIVDLIHRAVKRIFEGENGQPPVAPSVKLINLSVGDPSRPFSQAMSPWAKLLDWLSMKYNVLFVISAGNHGGEIPLQVSSGEFDQLQQAGIESATIKALYQNARNLRLLSPAESINGVTVGSAHIDHATGVVMGDRIDPYDSILLPSPISAFGSGYRRSIKPDIIYSGGKQLYRKHLVNDSVLFERVDSRSAPGNRVACPGTSPGDISATLHCCGTSNAAALITRAGGFYHDLLTQIFNEQGVTVEYKDYLAPLIKAMIVHGSKWGDTAERISGILQVSDMRQLRNHIARWVGYGFPEIERVLNSTEQRVTLLGFGGLEDNGAHVFQLPLPPSLGSRTDWRRLTVTLAWISPVETNTQKYRTASLWFEANHNIVSTRKDADWKAVRRGTVQHEIFEDQKAVPLADGEVMNIKVNCKNDAGKIASPVPYGIVVTLEVGEGVNIAVYDEVRARILTSVRVQSGDEV